MLPFMPTSSIGQPLLLCPCKVAVSKDCKLPLLCFYGDNKRVRCLCKKRVFRACVIASGSKFDVEVGNFSKRGVKSVALRRFSDGLGCGGGDERGLCKQRVVRACVIPGDGGGGAKFNVEVANSARRGVKSVAFRRFSDELGGGGGGGDGGDERGLGRDESVQLGGSLANFQQDNGSSTRRGAKGVVLRRFSDELGGDGGGGGDGRGSVQDESMQLGGRFANLQQDPKFNVEVGSSARRGAKGVVLRRFSDELGCGGDDERGLPREESMRLGSGFANFEQDPIVDKLRTQLGVIHPIPAPPINRNVLGLFVFFFFVGVVTDKIWNRFKRKKSETQLALWRQTPTSFSMFLEKDLQRKESVEWVNMVLGKLWKVYRPGLENWLVGLLQPVIDNLQKPDYVQRVEVKQFSLGDEPLSVRSVERRTSRRVNDLQYQIGLRYSGGARMLLMLSLKFGILPIVVPVGIQDFDIDGELWVKLRLIPTEPWVGAVQWAFVSLPKIKFELSPFRLFNVMAIPVLSLFLTKLLTEDLPRLFVRPKKIVLDFQKGEAVGPVPQDPKSGDVQERNKDFVGELSVTLVDARNLSYLLYGKTDPYVVLRLGNQTIRSKKNSQTTVIGPPGEPIWNQDFNLLVQNPRKQKLSVEVVDSLGFADMTVGTAEVDLGNLQDTVVTDKIAVMTGGWNLLRKRNSGEIFLRLTYKAYVEDEEDEGTKTNVAGTDISEDEASDADEADVTYKQMPEISMPTTDKESFMDVLAALIVSEEFQGIVASETGIPKVGDDRISSGTTTPTSQGLSAEPISSKVDAGSGASKGSALFWLAVITSVAVIIALNVGGSSLFNP